MLRYFAISTVLVLGIAVLASAWIDRDLIRIKIASVYARAPAHPQPAQTVGAGPRTPVHIEAAWVLSALPECLLQTSKSAGSRAYVLSHLPAGAAPVVPPATLEYGDCTILVSGGEAFVRRGPDRFVIPAPVQFFRTPDSLALLRSGPAGNELRVYQETKPQ